MTGFSITLEARNPEREHYRAYRVEAAPDLFGVWLVEATFGRIGCTLAYAASDEAEARRIVRAHLNRRTTAPKRIGTAKSVITSFYHNGLWFHCAFGSHPASRMAATS